MSRSKNNGGPAFPTHHANFDGEEGMSQRDYFAAQLAAGIVSGSLASGTTIISSEVARLAYGFADAMITERSK